MKKPAVVSWLIGETARSVGVTSDLIRRAWQLVWYEQRAGMTGAIARNESQWNDLYENVL